MRLALVSTLCLLTGVCAASNYRDVQRAVADDQLLPLVTSTVFVRSSPVTVYLSSAVGSSSASITSGARGTRSPDRPSASMSSHSRPTEDRADVAKGTVIASV